MTLKEADDDRYQRQGVPTHCLVEKTSPSNLQYTGISLRKRRTFLLTCWLTTRRNIGVQNGTKNCYINISANAC